MIENIYAIVRGSLETEHMKIKNFVQIWSDIRWHDNFENAKAEAERLCQKEQCQFIILRAIAVCRIGKMPVEWEE